MKRRDFVKLSALTGVGALVSPTIGFSHDCKELDNTLMGKRIGIIGLDTSHCQIFTQIINKGEVEGGYNVVAAYAHGSPDIPSALEMKPRITEAVKEYGS